MQAKTTLPTLLILFFGPGYQRCRANGADDELQVVWRDEKHAGVNALFVYLRSLDRPISYSDLMEPHQQLPRSVAEIIDHSKNIGYPCIARQITPHELIEMSLPVIVHVDGDEPTKGDFLVLTHIGDSVKFFESASMLLSELSNESFLRQWNGIVIVEDEDVRTRSRFCWLASLGFSLGFCLQVLVVWCRCQSSGK